MNINEIKKIREKLGCGLSEAAAAFQRYGSAEAALRALDTSDKVMSWQDSIANRNTQSMFFEALLAQGNFKVAEDGLSWRTCAQGEQPSTARELAHAVRAACVQKGWLRQ